MIISDSEEKKSLPGSDRKNPAVVFIKERYPLTKQDSTKQVYHISLDLGNAPLRFKVGDSIGIYAQNDPRFVEHLITAMQAAGEDSIQDPRSGEPLSLRHFLTHKANIARLTSGFIKLLCEHGNTSLQPLLQPENKAQLTHFLAHHEPLDLLTLHSAFKLPLQELCAQFSPLLPRFYSVASSPIYLADEVHLTVALTVYKHREEHRFGVASHFLCNLAELHTPIPVYVQPAHSFTLPQDDSQPIIMIGPGTGVAPFRAFLQERLHRKATGKNWLFFGDRHRGSDYYYQEFWEGLAAQGHLKLDVAFSRDQEHKIYVQHLMYQNAAELFAWLEQGAYFYVCGDAERMAKDVEAMLHTIAQEQGAMSPDAAKAYVKALRTQKRYLADVY